MLGAALLCAPAALAGQPLPAASAPQPGAAGATTVAMDVRDVSTEDFRRFGLLELQRRLALRLLQAGFAVLAADKRPSVLLAIGVRGDGLEVTARLAGHALQSTIPRGAGGLEGFHLEVIHKAVELGRQAAALLPSPRPPTPRRAPPPRAAPPAGPPAPARPPWYVELDVGAMALLRLQVADPLIRVGARWGAPAGLGIRLSFGFKPAVDDALDATEWSVQAGLAWRVALPARLRLDLGLLGGALQHLYAVAGAQPPSGSQWDFLGTALAELGWQPLAHLGVAIWVAPGIAEGSREHLLDGAVIWRRTAARIELGATLVLRP